MLCVKAITVRFHLSHPAEKQAWEKLLSMRTERHLSFSQAVADTMNAYGTEGLHLSRTEKDELVQEITESLTTRLQQMLPAYLAGYSAGASAPIVAAVAPVHSELQPPAAQLHGQETDDTMPDFGDSCMDFDFIGGKSVHQTAAHSLKNASKMMHATNKHNDICIRVMHIRVTLMHPRREYMKINIDELLANMPKDEETLKNVQA